MTNKQIAIHARKLCNMDENISVVYWRFQYDDKDISLLSFKNTEIGLEMGKPIVLNNCINCNVDGTIDGISLTEKTFDFIFYPGQNSVRISKLIFD